MASGLKIAVIGAGGVGGFGSGLFAVLHIILQRVQLALDRLDHILVLGVVGSFHQLY